MKCELFVNYYLPAIRAVIANKLIRFGLTQQEVANKLHLTQPAIAFYRKRLRGKKIEELEKKDEIKRQIDEIAREVMTKNLKEDELEKEYCEICRSIFSS